MFLEILVISYSEYVSQPFEFHNGLHTSYIFF
jgi:hypothetical protein